MPSADPDQPAVEAVHEAVGELLEHLQLSSTASDERRAHQRVAFHGRVEIRGVGTPPMFGFVRNLSKGGIALLTTIPLPFEDRVILLPQAGRPVLGVRCRIVRCIKIKEGLYDIGASFVALTGATAGVSGHE
jgi:hypothetical protein